MVKTNEHAFEAVIEAALLKQGYLQRSSQAYDAGRGLIPQDLFDFVQASQPKMWAKFLKIHSGQVAAAKTQFLTKLAKDLARRGTLSLLRDTKGFRIEGCKFKLVYFRPVSGLNPETQKQYLANRLAVLRQLYYRPSSPDKPRSGPSIDLGLFVNGLPIFTAELKNQLTGQTVEDAKLQYQRDRDDPTVPLLAFGRCLGHFAVDNNEVYVTSQLQGDDTLFLPFNQGYGNGAGNPPSATGLATAYLWEQIWSKDSVLNLLQHFIHEIEVEDDTGQKTGERRLIFPRYHQIEAVRRLVEEAYDQGPGQRYLIQHSAGSGKSFSIAWLAHQLSVLHDRHDEPVFNSVVVITDRRVLDRQLQQNVRQFQQVEGVVENIDKHSRQLKEALESGKKIIVTTLQKFPVIVNSIGELAGYRFAVIVDEAHSSQSGESRKSVHAVLTVTNLEAEAEVDEEESPGEDIEDLLVEEASQRKMPPNVSFFAFTATPKQKTMELFGTLQPDGRYAPFSLYSMRQAIEEEFILDVLENYTTYKTYWNLLKTIEDDPHYDRHKAARLIKTFVEEHKLILTKKVEIIVEHLVNQVVSQIKGQAKAMLVTHSRRQAVRFKLAIDRYLKEQGHPFKTLVAFSGALQVTEGGVTYTEANMNGFSDKQTAAAFKRREYRLMIVANKFQTGFDQPLLHTMYVDKKLSGVHAVQTLSRLNRVYPDKEGTAVLDFVNEADTIQKSFQPYYDRTILSEKTDPNLLYDLESRLDNHFFYAQDELDRFAQIYLTAADQTAALPHLHAILDQAVKRFNQADPDAQADFRKALTDYVRLYAFLSQTARFEDADLEKLYLFGKMLARKLPKVQNVLPLEVQEQIELESLRVTHTSAGNIDLDRGEGQLTPLKVKETRGPFNIEEDRESLSVIIKELNNVYGFDASDEEIITVERVETKLDESAVLKVSAQVNSKENFKLSFENAAKEKFQELIEDNFKLYKKIMDDPDFAQSLLDALFERYLNRLGSNGEALGGA